MTTLCPINAYVQPTIHIIPEEEFLLLEQQAYNNMIAKYEGSNNSRSSSSYEYDYRPVKTVTSGLSPYRNAAGQPLEGTMWETSGSGFYWKNSSYSPGTFSMDVSFSANEIVSVGMSFQPGTITEENTSYFTEIGTSNVNKFVKLQVARKYSVTHYKIYRKIRTESTWTYIGDEYPSAPVAQAFKVVEVE